MAQDTETFNKNLYDLLKVRGYKPVPLNSQNQRVGASQQADVIEFTFTKDGEDFGKAWISVDDASHLKVYFDNEQQDSPDTKTPGVDYDDTWTGLLKHLKKWAQRRQLSFELANKDRLGDDMRQRDYYKMKEKLGESYHPMGKKASYNDAVPNVKIVLQHNRALEEGEQRYRNVARIFLENADGERFLAPTTRPGIARVYARHIAEGGLPNDERWNHIKTVVEDYNKMAGFVRATRNGEFNESALELVNEGVNHYNNLRETLKKMSGHRGYHAYFESWTPTLMEGEGEDLSEMFMSQSLDPRIESAMPILSRLKKPVSEMEEVDTLAEWADDIINEKLELDELSPAKKWDYTDKGRASLDTLMNKVAGAEDSESAKKYADKAVKRQFTIDKTEKSLARGSKVHEKMDSTTKTMAVPADKMLEAPGAETLSHNQATAKSNLKAFGLAEDNKEDSPIGKGSTLFIVTNSTGRTVKVLADYDWQAKKTAQAHWEMPNDAGIRVTKGNSDAEETPTTAPTNKSSDPLDAAGEKANGAEKPGQGSALKKPIDFEPPGGRDVWTNVARGALAAFGIAEGDVVPFKQNVEANYDEMGYSKNPKNRYYVADFTLDRLILTTNDLEEAKREAAEWAEHDDLETAVIDSSTGKQIIYFDGYSDAVEYLEGDDDSWIPDVEDFDQEEEIRNRSRKPANDIEENLNKQQKSVGQVGPTEKAKKISPILGKPQKEHPFNGKLVGAESKEVDPELARIMEIAGIKKN